MWFPITAWRDGREAEGSGLLNRHTVEKPYRGFESLSLRQIIQERWPSGLRRTPGKGVYGELYREFESLSFRQIPWANALFYRHYSISKVPQTSINFQSTYVLINGARASKMYLKKKIRHKFRASIYLNRLNFIKHFCNQLLKKLLGITAFCAVINLSN